MNRFINKFCHKWRELRSKPINNNETTLDQMEIIFPVIDIDRVHEQLGFAEPINYPASSLHKSLKEWKMEIDDAPIIRYLYKQFRPTRHLEFGTWQGQGTLYCLEESDATVWTINLPGGENKLNGEYAYCHGKWDRSIYKWARQIGLPKKGHYQTDTIGFIGRYYLENNLGNRVCQIYCDSRDWDITNFPRGFFDTVLIDGGHQKDIVINDTKKALQLLRSEGLIMWHDFCPPIWREFECTRGVFEAISELRDWLLTQVRTIFWIYPSWILLAIKK